MRALKRPLRPISSLNVWPHKIGEDKHEYGIYSFSGEEPNNLMDVVHVSSSLVWLMMIDPFTTFALSF